MQETYVNVSEEIGFDLSRRVVSYKTADSWKEVPHVSYIYKPDITNFFEGFRKLKERSPNLTFNTLMFKVIAEGLVAAPVLNSHFEYSFKKAEGLIRVVEQVNIAFPWLLPDERMINPTVFNTQKLTLEEITQSIKDIERKIGNTYIDELLYKTALVQTLSDLRHLRFGTLRRVISHQFSKYKTKRLSGKAKSDYYDIPERDRLTENDLLTGTVTVSNLGSLYREQKGYIGLLEIIPPQVFVVGLNAVQEEPGVFVNESGEKEIGIRKILPMCLAFDHRVCDFVNLVPFIKRLDEIFADPSVITDW